MTNRQTQPFGTWTSPLTTTVMNQSSVRLGNIQWYNGNLYWSEGRPAEKGRTALAYQAADGSIETAIPEPWNVRTRIHEYGGLSFEVSDQGIVFSNFSDGGLYVVGEGDIQDITDPKHPLRFGAMKSDPVRGGWIAVGETEPKNHSHEPENRLVRIRPNGTVETLVEGADFYADPVISPDGSEIAWIEWDHPFMAWDSARLLVGDLDASGELISARTIAGGPGESPFQPQYSPEGELYFISDPRGWWNLMHWNGEAVRCVWEAEEEMGLPLWVLGMSTYGFLNEQVAGIAHCSGGLWHLSTVDLETGASTTHELPFTEIHQVRGENEKLAVLAGGPTMPTSLVVLDGEQGTWEIIRESSSFELSDGYVSEGKPISFPTSGGEEAHGFFYPPANPDFQGEDSEKPPLIVMSHGGPTAATSTALSAKIQFWTTRGFAVLDVNYRGSTGYGRTYREKLLGEWGVADVDDCEAGALYAADQGWVDRDRMAIRGGSAGGYTTLAALTFRSTFRVGASYYGVSDIQALDEETHKFESRYTQRLIAPLPEGEETFHARSPIHHAENLDCPVIFLQGLDDKVVPPNQSEEMANVLQKKGIPTCYIAYEGEGHGFRKPETIAHSILSELAFYAHVFGFRPADECPELDWM